jgi:hypothetical protein
MCSMMRRLESSKVDTPPPPPSPDAHIPVAPTERPPHLPRAGDLTRGWRIVTVLGWILIVAVLAAAWSVSRQLGLSTWWLGPVDGARPPYVTVLPFIGPSTVIVLAGNRARYVPWVGLLAAAATAAVGLGDLSRIRGVALVELLAAAAGLLVSLASFSGMYRTASASVTDDADESVGESVDVSVGESVGAPVYRAGEPAPG